MEFELNEITRSIIVNKKAGKKKQVIKIDYDRVYTALKSHGFNDFISHEWAVTTLSKLYGSNIVNKSIR
jgi:hypothetical protein